MKYFAKNCVYVLLLVVISIVLIETMLRLLWRNKTFNAAFFGPANMFMVDPDIGLVLRPGQYGEIEIDKNGLRIHSKPPRDHCVRVLVVGGSTTFGTGSSKNNTFPAAIQKSLNSPANSECFELLNGGMIGYTTFHILKFLKKKLPILKPDIVIIASQWNDLPWAWWDGAQRERNRTAGIPGNILQIQTEAEYKVYANLRVLLLLSDLAGKFRLNQIINHLMQEGYEPNPAVVETYFNNLDVIFGMIRNSGSVPMFLFLPLGVCTDSHDSQKIRLPSSEIKNTEKMFALAKAFLRWEHVTNKKFIAFSERKKLNVIYCNAIYEENSCETMLKDFMDFMHPNENGYEKIGMCAAGVIRGQWRNMRNSRSARI